ncbi:MAG: GlsB/YeaQ/YmgE family stress response membrane protein [Rhizobiaceae bacterium]|nr:MAG: GlsB/YeaQ/YmgE family stress response membrane protein [Rhizobiaceae bacterium]
MIVYLIIGGIIGWLASIVMRTNAQQGIILNIVVGIVGSFIGGVLFGSSLGTGSMMGWLSAFVGAVILLAIVNMVRRGSLR